MNILKKASFPSTPRRGRPGRRRTAVGALVALSVLAGAVPAFGAFTADPVPRAYAGRYVLYYNDGFAGPVRNVSGCTTDITLVETRDVSGPPHVSPGPPKLAPCVIDVGLNMSEEFRSAVVASLNTGPTVGNWAIGRLNGQGSAVASELRFSGYVSDVTLPTLHRQSASDPSWIRVELVSSDATVRTVTNPERTVGSLEEEPIESAQPIIGLNVDGAGRNVVAADPLEVIRDEEEPKATDGSGRTLVSPARALKLSQPRLRTAEAPPAVNALTTWFQATTTGKRDTRSLSLGYRSISGAHRLDLDMLVFPTHFDPFPRTDNRRLLAVAGDPVVTVTWS